MDIKELKELREETCQYRALNDYRCKSTTYEDDVLALIDEKIARQTVTDEPLAMRDFTDEEEEIHEKIIYANCKPIMQTVTDEAVQESVEWLKTGNWLERISPTEMQLHYTKHDGGTAGLRQTAITALQQYQKPTDAQPPLGDLHEMALRQMWKEPNLAGGVHRWCRLINTGQLWLWGRWRHDEKDKCVCNQRGNRAAKEHT